MKSMGKKKQFFLKLLLLIGFAGVFGNLNSVFGEGMIIAGVVFLVGFLFMKLQTAMKYMLPASIVLFMSTILGNYRGFFPNAISTMLFMGLIAYYVLVPKNKKPKEKNMPKITEDKLKHYEKSGLSESDVAFFRQTMALLQKQIKQWEDNLGKNSKLKAIDLRVDGLKAAKALFKEIVQSPNRMNQASEFIYRYVPNMVGLTDNYIEVNNHDIKTADTYKMLNDSATVIEELGKQINEAYTKFVKHEIDTLDTELSIAKKNIKMDNGKVAYTDVEIGKQQDLSIPDFSMDVPDYSKYLEKEKSEVK